MKLIIVESPTKARTIAKFFDKGFEIFATMGHFRDLPKSRFGVEIKEKNGGFSFLPEYVLDTKKKDIISKIKKLCKKAEIIYLATDPDREGEAIAYHTSVIGSNSKVNSDTSGQNAKIKRIVFHEITKEAIDGALKNPHKIDVNLVNAQQARRVLDRLVGYSLSPLLWKKIKKGLSAGRVQSVAARLIVEREREIEKFNSEKFFRIGGEFRKKDERIRGLEDDKKGAGFQAELVKIDGKSIELKEKHNLFDGEYTVAKTILDKEDKAKEIISSLSKNFQISNLKSKIVLRRPFPPYTTSTLQQDAARRFGWPAKQTMQTAQRLFEKGLITYHRTDSTILSGSAVAAIRLLISKEFGQKYLPAKPIFYKTRSKLAQEAHEAIRATNFHPPAGGSTSNLQLNDQREKKLYELIWQRAVASQTAPAKIAQTKIELTPVNDAKYLFAATGSSVIFDGFSRVYPIKFSENTLPPLKEKEEVNVSDFNITEHNTSPPPRYNEASLIASLERHGIGRPSTYAAIIFTIQKRLYVEKKEGKFFPTTIGFAVNDFLVMYFEEIVNLPFTAEMENSFDDVAKGTKEWQPVLSDFWGPFAGKLKKTEEKAERVKVPLEKTGKKCPKCKEGDLVVRLGRFGKFIACSRFPKCDYKENHNEAVGFNCPDCGAPAVVRRSKRGFRFYGCSKYPACKWLSWKKPKK